MPSDKVREWFVSNPIQAFGVLEGDQSKWSNAQPTLFANLSSQYPFTGASPLLKVTHFLGYVSFLGSASIVTRSLLTTAFIWSKR